RINIDIQVRSLALHPQHRAGGYSADADQLTIDCRVALNFCDFWKWDRVFGRYDCMSYIEELVFDELNIPVIVGCLKRNSMKRFLCLHRNYGVIARVMSLRKQTGAVDHFSGERECKRFAPSFNFQETDHPLSFGNFRRDIG